MSISVREFVEKKYPILMTLAIIISIVVIVVISKGTTDKIESLYQDVDDLVLFPIAQEFADTLFEASVYSDNVEEGGKSEAILVNQDSTGVAYRYTVATGIEYPYAGLSLWANQKTEAINSNIDISEYTHLVLDITAENSSSEMVIIKPIVPTVTKEYSSGSRGFFGAQIPLVNERFQGAIALEKMVTPSWWYSNNGITETECPAADFGNVIEIIFQQGDKIVLDREVNVTINTLLFEKRPSDAIVQEKEDLAKGLKQYIITTVLILLLTLTLLSSMKFIKKVVEEDDDSEKIIISYDRVEIEEEQNNDLQRITEYIASNYANPEFSVEQLAKGAGVSTSKIPTLLKKQYSMNFKQYLNTVRITEAKRLLLESDHQIVTIAHSVGYNNIPHFNRTFKQLTELSPKKFRENPSAAAEHLPGSVDSK